METYRREWLELHGRVEGEDHMERKGKRRRRRVCRICLETEDDTEEMLRPCLCRGSMKYVHRACLDTWRAQGLNARSLTHCGVCSQEFKIETRDSRGAAEEWKVALARYLGIRVGGFFLVVVVCGFMPRVILGDELMQAIAVSGNPAVNHLCLGSAGAFMVAGFWSIASVTLSYHSLPWRIFNRRSEGRRDSAQFVLILIIICGILFLLWHLARGIYTICTQGKQIAIAHLRHENEAMRSKIVQRYRVLNFADGSESSESEEEAG